MNQLTHFYLWKQQVCYNGKWTCKHCEIFCSVLLAREMICNSLHFPPDSNLCARFPFPFTSCLFLRNSQSNVSQIFSVTLLWCLLSMSKSTVEPGYNDISLCDISSIVSDILWCQNSLLSTTTLCCLVMTTVVYDTKYSVRFMIL